MSDQDAPSARRVLHAVLLGLWFTVGTACPPGGPAGSEAGRGRGGESSHAPSTIGEPERGTLHAVNVKSGSSTVSELGVSEAVLSADGRYAAFISASRDLVAGMVAPPGVGVQPQLYLRDLVEGTTWLVSHVAGAPNRPAESPVESVAISADGRYVAYAANSHRIAGRIPNGFALPQVFLFDRETATNRLVSHAFVGEEIGGNYKSRAPSISQDGRFVAFVSDATDLVEGMRDAPGTSDIYVWDRDTGQILLASAGAGTTQTGANNYSDLPSISADGRFVAFVSMATDLVEGQLDDNRGLDLFLYDRGAGTTTLLSGRSPRRCGNAGSAMERPSISADGRFVAYTSDATDLQPGLSGDSSSNVFLFDREQGSNRLVSHLAGRPTTMHGWLAESPSISADGNVVAFISEGSLLVEGQFDDSPMRNVYLWDRRSGRAELASHGSASRSRGGEQNAYEPHLSADGNWVIFASDAPRLSAGQRDEPIGMDSFIYSRASGAVTLISHDASDPKLATNGSGTTRALLAADGSVALFTSLSPAHVADDATTSEIDLFVWRRSP